MSEGLRPLFLAKPNSISRSDISRAEKLCGICIIECVDPEATRFCHPPIDAKLDAQALAALDLMRMVSSSGTLNFSRGDLTRWFVDQLLTWNKPKEVPSVKQGAK